MASRLRHDLRPRRVIHPRKMEVHMGKRIAFIPGFMGTNLYQSVIPGVLKVRNWVSGTTLTAGGLRRLRLGDNPGDSDGGTLYPDEVNQGVYSSFLEFLVSQRHQVETYGYDWRRNSAHSTESILQQLLRTLSFGDLDCLICHSYGGCLAARVLAQLAPANRARVKMVITVGSPFRGAFHPGTSLAKYGQTVKFMSIGVGALQLCNFEEAESRVTNTLSSWDATYILMPSFSLINELVHAPNEWTRDSQVWNHGGFWHNGAKGEVGAADMDRGWNIPAGINHVAIVGVGIPTPGPFKKPQHKYGDDGHVWIDGDGVVPIQSSRPANGSNASVWTVRGEHEIGRAHV